MNIVLTAEELSIAQKLRSDLLAARAAHHGGLSIVNEIDVMASTAQSLENRLHARGHRVQHSRAMFANRKNAARDMSEAFYQNLHAIESLLNLLGV